jgi:hypothetical protein
MYQCQEIILVMQHNDIKNIMNKFGYNIKKNYKSYNFYYLIDLKFNNYTFGQFYNENINYANKHYNFHYIYLLFFMIFLLIYFKFINHRFRSDYIEIQ